MKHAQLVLLHDPLPSVCRMFPRTQHDIKREVRVGVVCEWCLSGVCCVLCIVCVVPIQAYCTLATTTTPTTPITYYLSLGICSTT